MHADITLIICVIQLRYMHVNRLYNIIGRTDTYHGRLFPPPPLNNTHNDISLQLPIKVLC